MDKHIFRKRKALDLRTCQHIIHTFLQYDQEWNEDTHYYAIYPKLSDVTFSFFKPILRKYMDEYAEKHKFLSSRNPYYSSWDINERFNIQKYDPGGSYAHGEHTEHGMQDWNSRRILAWMIYLNDIKKDGGTCWPQQNFTTRPRAGDLYIWPAGWTHSHYGIPAPNETKYIITGWCSWVNREGETWEEYAKRKGKEE